MKLLYDPVIYPREINAYVLTQTSPWIFLVALFVTVKTRNNWDVLQWRIAKQTVVCLCHVASLPIAESYSGLKRNQLSSPCGDVHDICKEFCVKASPKWQQTVWYHLYNILSKVTNSRNGDQIRGLRMGQGQREAAVTTGGQQKSSRCWWTCSFTVSPSISSL